ncbi:yicC-like protein [Asticcacaulis biprosthecium C19]|uniref:YicC-like protein n=2 Tax=Asticcacaulis biprosthecium TaxID=76891 RepID=F4QRD7_9CAUL|nr:yicC-like protein [Asticcacaulis biprosthecium C19]
MTGFARVEGSAGDTAWVIEVRSVNGRSLDVKYRFPPGFEAVERLGRELVKGRLTRGQVTLNVSVSSATGKGSVGINHDVLAAYLDAGHDLIKAGKVKKPRLDGLLSLRGVIDSASDDREGLDEAGEAALGADLARAFDGLKAAREAEGRALNAILKSQLVAMAAALERAKSLAAQQVEIIRDRFTRRMNELLADQAGFEERVLQEAAVLAAKADVREELDRLTSHIDQAHGLIDGEPAPGRKLDFLAQEFMREANTLCSKAAFIELTQTGLELKSVIDQFREQTQNVE